MSAQKNRERLAATVEMLQLAYDRALEDRARDYECDIDNPGLMLLVTADGRYILLDALTALVQAQTVLVQAETFGPEEGTH